MMLRRNKKKWQKEAEATSGHLKLLSYDIDVRGPYVFLTLAFDTDEAMGMNMATIAAQAAGEWIMEHLAPKGARFVTVAGNVDSDKKPSRRTKERGRGFCVTAEALISDDVIEKTLKTSTSAMLAVARAKLGAGSKVAGALGTNLHVANMMAALGIATGQDPAHVVEASLADTTVKKMKGGLRISVTLPALIVGIRGGGMALPTQSQCLEMLLHPVTKLHPREQLAESIAAAVLAGELSLLAAQSNHTLATSHKTLARKA
jgi:hydroxymethylglutaryl-CoA reductase (NADPH)